MLEKMSDPCTQFTTVFECVNKKPVVVVLLIKTSFVKETSRTSFCQKVNRWRSSFEERRFDARYYKMCKKNIFQIQETKQ